MASKQEMLDMAARLRATVSESKRKMLDEAAMMLEEAADAVDRATEDVEPVRHGHWIPDSDDDWYECSSCRCLWMTIHGTPQDNNMRFCPECGAKMDGGGKEIKQDDEQREYVFECPVKPGQKVYFARFYCGTTEDEVISVTFYEEDGEIKWEALNDVDECFGNGTGMPTKWNVEVFATREEAEAAFEEMRKNDVSR